MPLVVADINPKDPWADVESPTPHSHMNTINIAKYLYTELFYLNKIGWSWKNIAISNHNGGFKEELIYGHPLLPQGNNSIHVVNISRSCES